MSSKSSIKTIFAYVDGYNLYHGMMDSKYTIPNDPSRYPLRKYLWLDLHSFIQSYFPQYYILERIYYFTAPVRDNPKALMRQSDYLKALESIPNMDIQYGKHIFINNRYSEKQSDVKLALQMYHDALFENPSCMVLFCADSDQVPTVERIKSLSKDIEIRAIFPPCRKSDDLKKLIEVCHKVKYTRLKEHQFDDPLIYEMEGVQISVSKPKEWS